MNGKETIGHYGKVERPPSPLGVVTEQFPLGGKFDSFTLPLIVTFKSDCKKCYILIVEDLENNSNV